MSSKLEYRKLDKSDLHEVSKLVWCVFREFEAPEYADEGIEEFRKFVDVNNLESNYNSKNMEFYGCFLEGSLIGVISTRQLNHISLMFVDKDFHRQGIAKKLFELVKRNLAEKCEGETIITVNSSPYAEKIYECLGFRKTDMERVKNGIRFIPMEYKLTNV